MNNSNISFGEIEKSKKTEDNQSSSNTMKNIKSKIISKKIKNIFEISKCGFSGIEISKINQDNYVITKNMLNDSESYFFAVL